MITDPVRAASPPLSLARLLEPEVRDDPYPFYRDIDSAGGVVWDPYLHTWLVTGYRDVVRVFQECLAARTPTPETFAAMGLPMLRPAAQVMRRMMMFMDPPHHMRIRSACAAAFTPRRLQQLRTQVTTSARKLLATMRNGEPWNVLPTYAEPLPAMITTALIGLPVEDWRLLKRWSDDFADLIGNFHQSPEDGAAVAGSLAALDAYVARAIDEQRKHPRDGMIATLLAQRDGGGLDNAEIVANVLICLVGGLGSTTQLINTGLSLLIDRPSDMAAMRDDPETLASGIEELLRFESPSQFSGRIAATDMIIAGQRIARGDAIMAITAAANRDPRLFDDPNRLDVRRTPNRHLAFAWGAHFCFGATLARMTASIAFKTLFDAVSRLSFADRPLQWRDNLSLRGLTALWVTPELARDRAR